MRLMRLGLALIGLGGVALVGAPARAATPDSNGFIAFTSARSGGTAVWVMSADGSRPTRLTKTRNPAWDGFPSFSPDGRRIAYMCGNFEICVMNANGSYQAEVTHHAWTHRIIDSVPSWSPDGARIAFDRVKGGTDSLYVVNVDGSGLRQLTHGSLDEDAAWSPDGTRIAFDGLDRFGNSQIFVVNVDGSGRHELTASATTYSIRPAWSPDGQLIVYERTGDGFGLHHLWVMNADGTGGHALTSGPWNEANPSWSPDGRLIAYDSNQGFVQNVWTMNRDGTGQTQLTHGTGFNISPTWQPVPSTPPATPPPKTSSRRPSPPIPETRLVAVSWEAAFILNDEVAGLASNPNPTAALSLGDRLIKDGTLIARRAAPIRPTTKFGKTFKSHLLAMCADARGAGRSLNAVIVDAFRGDTTRARRDQRAAASDLARMFDEQSRLFAMSG